MHLGKLYYAKIFPFLTNKKEIKPRSNIFKIDSVVSTKLSPDSSFIERLGWDSPFEKIDEDPVLSLCLISTMSTLLDKFGILQYLSNNNSNELLMIGIALVKNSAKPTIFGTGDSEWTNWKVVHLIVSVPHYRNVAHLKLKSHQEGTSIYNDWYNLQN